METSLNPLRADSVTLYGQMTLGRNGTQTDRPFAGSAFLCFESPSALFASQRNLFLTMWLGPAKGLLLVKAHSKVQYIYRCIFTYYFENEFEGFIRFPNARNIWNHEAAGRVVLLFSSVWKSDFKNPKHEVLKLLFQQRKLVSNYHLNKFSQ